MSIFVACGAYEPVKCCYTPEFVSCEDDPAL